MAAIAAIKPQSKLILTCSSSAAVARCSRRRWKWAWHGHALAGSCRSKASLLTRVFVIDVNIFITTCRSCAVCVAVVAAWQLPLQNTSVHIFLRCTRRARQRERERRRQGGGEGTCMYCELIAAHYFTILPANKQAKSSCSPEWHGKRPEPALRHAYYQAPSLSLLLSLLLSPFLSLSVEAMRQAASNER